MEKKVRTECCNKYKKHKRYCKNCPKIMKQKIYHILNNQTKQVMISSTDIDKLEKIYVTEWNDGEYDFIYSYDGELIRNKVEVKLDSDTESMFDDFKQNMINARRTLFPNKTIEEVYEILKKIK